MWLCRHKTLFCIGPSEVKSKFEWDNFDGSQCIFIIKFPTTLNLLYSNMQANIHVSITAQ